MRPLSDLVVAERRGLPPLHLAALEELVLVDSSQGRGQLSFQRSIVRGALGGDVLVDSPASSGRSAGGRSVLLQVLLDLGVEPVREQVADQRTWRIESAARHRALVFHLHSSVRVDRRGRQLSRCKQGLI